MHYVYVLLSAKDNKFYIGYTQDIEKRIKDHNQGKNTSTQTCRPLKLLYYEAHTSTQDAKRREIYLKTSKGKTTLKQTLRIALSSA